jgi:hypothetical protein
MNNINDIVYVKTNGKCKILVCFVKNLLNLTFQCIRVDIIVTMQLGVKAAHFAKNLNVFHHGVF